MNLTVDILTQGIAALYIDGVGFEYKSNPYDHTKSLGSREWRMIHEGLFLKREKRREKVVSFMVSMKYGAGVVMWVPLTRRMSGEYFEELVETEIKCALQNSGKTCNRILFLFILILRIFIQELSFSHKHMNKHMTILLS